jgi:polysaccharide biosynthesis protein PelB
VNNKDINLLNVIEDQMKILFTQRINFVVKRSLRLIITASLVFTTLLAWSEPADMYVGINQSPASDKTVELPNDFKLNLIKYNKEDYLLAYNVFIMNGSVNLAFEVASAAVKQRPKSIFWRKKLAQAALWSGHSEVALEQWMYFINNNITPDLYVANALKLSAQLYDYDTQAALIHRQLLKAPEDTQLLLKYSIALQNQGYPKDALRFLKRIPNAENNPAFLEQFDNVAKGLDNPSLQRYYLEQWRKIDGKNLKPAMELAELLYSQGDIAGAYKIYNSMANLPGNKIAFWRSYAAISLLTGQSQSAIDAYKQLLQKDALDSSSLLQMIRLEEESGQKESAYRFAKTAYQQDKNPLLIPVILSLGEQLLKWQEMRSFLAELPQEEIDKLEAKPEFAIMFINMKVQLGLKAEARRSWLWVFERWPNLTIVQRAYLWFLMDTNELKQLDYTLYRWRGILQSKPDLWFEYAAGLTNIGQYSRSLNVMLRHRKEINVNYSYLVSFANLLAHNNLPYEAYYAGKKAYYLLRKEINEQSGRLSLTQHLFLTELLQEFGPAPLIYNLVLNLSGKLFKDPNVDNQIMAWALSSQSYSLASYIASIHTLYQRHTPPLMTLTLALVYNDRYAMADMLFHYPKILPHRDRVTAAVRTGNLKLAEEYAYIGLKEHPKDYEMYKLFEDTMLPRSDKFTLIGEMYGIANAQGPFARASARIFVTPSIAVMPYGTLWFPRIIDKNIIAYAPNVNEKTGVAVRKYIHRGWLQGNIGQRAGFKDFLMAKLGWHRVLTPKTNMTLSLGYHDIATETDRLLLGGLQNQLSLLLQTTINSYNMVDTRIQLKQFYGQEETFLGTGQDIQVRWQKKFYLDYPDWNINFYGTWAEYQNSNNPISGQLQRFIPPGDPIDTQFFMPIGYKEGGMTFGVGQQYKTSYTHKWRPFFEAGLLYSDPFGLGQIAMGGIGGSVFGRDHLALYGEYTFNQQQAQQRNYTIGIRYDNYF